MAPLLLFFVRSIRHRIAQVHFPVLQGYHTTNPHSDLSRVQDITSIYAVLALQDSYSGKSTWSNTVLNGIQAYTKQNGFYGVPPVINSDGIYWVITFFYAYRTYKQEFLLDLAVQAYNETLAAFITPQVAAAGVGAGRNVSFNPPPGCTNSEQHHSCASQVHSRP